MSAPRNLWKELCSYENLELAYKKARKHKTTKDYVIGFERDLTNNLLLLRSELLLHCYQPKSLVNFILYDPKMRKISKSHFRDRVIHHALCNIIEPIFDKSFIYDSCANRKGKGTLKALQRFDYFKRKVSKNFTRKGFAFKADIKKYFENVDHEILLNLIKRKIKDKRVLWLINTILANTHTHTHTHTRKKPCSGMPLGNLTSQFFANVYLNELDQFVKHKLKAKYYVRYVDDFVILHNSKEILNSYKEKINQFLKSELKIELHSEKSDILKLDQTFNFLGFRIFSNHKLIKKRDWKLFKRRLELLCQQYNFNLINYDKIYDFLEGWFAHIKHANTYKLRKKIMNFVEENFSGEISGKEINRIIKIQKSFPNS